MNITVNAKPHEVSADTLDAALIELGFAGAAIATAVNGAFVSRDSRAATMLRPGDRIEVLSPMQGG